MKKYKPKSGERIEHVEEIIPPKVELPFEFSPEHYPVLLQEVLAAFYPYRQASAPTYFDGTFGRGGHYSAVKYTIPQMIATVMDQDLAAVSHAKNAFKTDVEKGQLNVIHGNFSEFSDHNLKNFDMMLLDLGVSSPQLDQAERGFSFYHDGPLDMRMNQQQGLTAEVLINTASEDDLIRIFKDYGEVYRPGKVVRAIVKDRKTKAFQSTLQLAGLIERVDGWQIKGHHPATKYFMALRLAVNSELEVVAEALPKMMKALNPKGRLAVISFHSLEDRIVKNIFRDNEDLGKPVYKKVIVPTQEECDRNSRSRSAKLRVFERSAQDELTKL
ncbi:16S rRNA (cytosine(1402)-N(4))-methyltransferase [Bdellovibrio bacteriovorus]|uniref:Ribosomal RNA small subunit methyltransferase H n=1 Tax=Bdellovibrio bacteriovorus TaxID=959 RepID=A0A150WNL4_BDEBC|nr:16S rRNA (cytosine(1402)-N(4))-methyltransferase RsmH [Bdellovibrio bacteriovorus]KYG66072.1 16S rRNA (cytosine(1402)-N(4))-methyltransferase [Bdellovibrio bacteriovorus]